MKQSLENYLKYLDSEEEFTYVLRMEYEWCQRKFEIMLSLVIDIFHEYKEENIIPKSLVHFFVREVDFIIGTTSKPVFFNHIPKGFTKDEYKRIVEQGQETLLALRQKFYAGDYTRI